MVVGKCLIDMRLNGTRSLKDKRRVIQSLLAHLKRFGLACAEVGENDTWGRALLGIACVSNQRRHAEEVLRRAVLWVEGNIDGEVLSSEIELIG
jgi:uncharacterized protein YlxP (DUF503 family)